MDHSSRWVSGSSQGLSCAIVAELFFFFFTRNQRTDCLILSLTCCWAGWDVNTFFFLTHFYVLSNDISASNLVIEVDCCEMTICNSKLIISLYYCAEMQAIMTVHENNKSTDKRSQHRDLQCQISPFFLSVAFIFSVTDLDLITICDITGWLRNTILWYPVWQQCLKHPDLAQTRSGGRVQGTLTDSWLQHRS